MDWHVVPSGPRVSLPKIAKIIFFYQKIRIIFTVLTFVSFTCASERHKFCLLPVICYEFDKYFCVCHFWGISWVAASCSILYKVVEKFEIIFFLDYSSNFSSFSTKNGCDSEQVTNQVNFNFQKLYWSFIDSCNSFEITCSRFWPTGLFTFTKIPVKIYL